MVITDDYAKKIQEEQNKRADKKKKINDLGNNNSKEQELNADFNEIKPKLIIKKKVKEEDEEHQKGYIQKAIYKSYSGKNKIKTTKNKPKEKIQLD